MRNKTRSAGNSNSLWGSIATPILTLIVLFAALASSGCFEEDMTISLDERLPPTFRLSGSGNLIFFSVSEVSPDDQHRVPIERSSNDIRIIWQIVPTGLSSDATIMRKLPPITYGSIPKGFEQTIPKTGVPPNLVEGKIYQAGGPASNANGGS